MKKMARRKRIGIASISELCAKMYLLRSHKRYQLLGLFWIIILFFIITRNKLPKESLRIKVCDCLPKYSNIAHSVYDGFRRMGFHVDLVGSVNVHDEESVYILTIVAEPNFELPKKYIAYNVDTLAPDMWFDDLDSRFLNAMEVWDISKSNIKFLHSKGIKSFQVLPGYHSSWSYGYQAISFAERTIDLLFIGSMNDRRMRFISEIKELYLNSTGKIATVVPWLPNRRFNDHPKELRIAKAGIHINYFDENNVIAWYRIMTFVSNRVLLLSQKIDDDEVNDMIEPMVTHFSSKNDFNDKFQKILGMNENDYMLEAMSRLKKLKEMPRFEYFLKRSESALANQRRR